MKGRGSKGFAHLIEHLIFHGTPNIPEGSLSLMLARRGLRNWSDFDAFTSFDETVYRLDMGKSDGPARDVRFDADARDRKQSPLHAFDRSKAPSRRCARRSPLGTRCRIRSSLRRTHSSFQAPRSPADPLRVRSARSARATAAALKRLYDLHYVPQRATLVIVGDFDPDVMEAEIAARFSDWRARGSPASERLVPVISGRRSAEAHLFVHPQAPTILTIASVRAASGHCGRRAGGVMHTSSNISEAGF
jgi:zinc protease